MTKPTRALHVFLSKYTPQHNAGIVRALANLPPWFDTVMLFPGVGSQEWPDAFANKLVGGTIDIIQRQKLRLIIGRPLWTSWDAKAKKLGNHPFSAGVFSHDFYIEAAARLREAAAIVGADATAIDIEPYGRPSRSIHRRTVKPPGGKLDPMIAKQIINILPAGIVDYILPSSSYSPTGYPWAFNNLGVFRCDEKTYYVKNPARGVDASPPPYDRHLIGLWGHHVSMWDSRGRPRKGKWLVPANVINYDMKTVVEKFAGCRGQWVYINAYELARVLRSKRWYPRRKTIVRVRTSRCTFPRSTWLRGRRARR